jgi:fermentation-respiration switch protein FrsA (DUF1100 family)
MAAGRAVARLAAALALALGCAGCSGLFYFPAQREFGRPAEPFTAVTIPTADGLCLSAWLLPARGRARGTIVQFHGNAGNITSHFKNLEWATEEGWALLTFDYRGYGASPGVPSQAGLEQDALAAIRYALSLPAVRDRDLVLYGQSLGGAVLLHAFDSVRDRRRIRAVVIESSFHSYKEAAASVLFRQPVLFPFTGFAYPLVSDAYSPSGTIERVSPIPLLVIHGDHDSVLDADFGRAIFAQAREPKELWIVPYGGHVDAMRRRDYRRRLLAYLERQ